MRSPRNTGFGGLCVVSFGTQKARETKDLIARRGGKPLIVPVLRKVPLGRNGDIPSFADKILSGDLDVLVLLTETGTRELLKRLKTKCSRQKVRKALRRVTTVARGPKTAAALRENGFEPDVRVRDPGTWREVLRALDGRFSSLKGVRVAVQEYGVPNLPFLRELQKRGAVLTRVPLYRWGFPENGQFLQRAMREMVEGRADVFLFTNATQVSHVFQIARELGVARDFCRVLNRSVVASIGPHCTERLREFGVRADLVPPRPRLKILVAEASRSSGSLLEKKRAGNPVRITSAARSSSRPEIKEDPLNRSLFMRACRREYTERTPLWLMRQAGRYMKNYRDLRSQVPMLELCKHPDLVTEVTVDAVRRLGVDAAILFSDLLLLTEPLGFKLEYSRGEGPLVRPRVRGVRDVDRLRDVDVEESLGFVREAVRSTRAALPPDIPLLGFAGAPFTLASYLIEGGSSRNFVRTKTFMHDEPEAWARLLGKISKGVIDYVNMQVRAGAQAIQIFDSWVGCLSPADYQKYVLPHSRAVFRGIRAGTPVIHFGTQTGELLELMKEAMIPSTRGNGKTPEGAVMGVDWRIRLDSAWSRLGEVAVMGNLDPAVLFSARREIRRQVRDILAQAGGRPGHIFNLGHGILPETPVDHVRCLVDAVKELSRRK